MEPIAAVAAGTSLVTVSERNVVADYVLERLISAFRRSEFQQADRLSRFHAVLMGMSDKEYIETA